MELHEFSAALRSFLVSKDDHFWRVDPRVQWDVPQDQFLGYFENNRADLLATNVRGYGEDPHWTWWKQMRSPLDQVPLSFGVAALLPLARFSREAAKAVLDGIEQGWSGHPEALIPTLVNRAGLVIEDIGGKGRYTPPERIGRWYDDRTWHWKGPVEHVPGKLHFPQIARYQVSAPAELSPEPLVAFLFLTKGAVHHPDLWNEYLEQAGSRGRVFAHTKDVSLLRQDSFLRDTQIDGKVATEWASFSLVEATLALLRAALEDTGTSHFILLSESCVPVRPFDQLRANLRRDARSRMRVWPAAEIQRGGDPNKGSRMDRLTGISMEHAYFHDQWICLSREDAMIVTERDWAPCFERVFIADECFFATVLAASGRPPGEASVNRPVTWTDWRGGAHPHEFMKVLPRDAARIAESGCYFARKFPAGSDIGRWALHRPDTHTSKLSV